MDLGQVEVIKGVASSLYGAGAMGGVVNLISRRPGPDRQREVLVNRSSLGATDLVAWYATPARPGWTSTFVGGGHWQETRELRQRYVVSGRVAVMQNRRITRRGP